MGRVTNDQILAAITGMVQQVDSLNERVVALEGKSSKTSKPTKQAAAKTVKEGTALPVGHLVLVKISKGIDRQAAAKLMGTSVDQVGYTHNLATGRIGKAMRQFGAIQPDVTYGGPAFFAKRCETVHAIGSRN